ncbi:MAG: hypothetical protein JKY94_03185 [Rhodobacteraceae bacterium]|nr:hypothetical protein [Paracoccaceae bacterium]
MLALLRFAVPLMIVLTVIYVALSLYSRNVRRGKLEAYWDKEELTGDREAFVDLGLKDYDGSLRRKLIWGVYIVPVSVIALLVYVMNYM